MSRAHAQRRGCRAGRGVNDMRDLLDRGMRRVTDLLGSFSDEEFATKPIPHPFGEPATPERPALSLITHMHHHRGQLHNYLRHLGVAVDTGTLYTEE